MKFVPEPHRGEDMPCHHIPLDTQGHTVDSLMQWGTQAEMEEALGS